MNFIRNLNQTQVAIFLAAYIGLVLNALNFYRRAQLLISHDSALGFLAIICEITAAFFATFVVLRLASLAGKGFFKLIASIISLVSVAAAYYMLVFNVIIGYGIVASVMTTDMDLSKEVLSSWFYIWVAVIGIPPLAIIWISRCSGDLLQQFKQGKDGFKAGIVILIGLALSWGPIRYLEHKYKAQEHFTNIDMPSYGGVVAHSYLPSNWISALGIFGWSRFTEDVMARNLFDPAKHFSYQAPQSLDNTYVVFVIGETTRWDHLGLLGYSRDTTPELSKEANLVAFRGISCDTATKLSLRCMFVRQGGTRDDAGRTLKEQNIFAVLKELGFSVELYAMQSEIWFYSKTDADNIEFREQIGSEPVNRGKPVADMLLIPKLSQSIEQHPKGKHLVILHTKGSHYLYSQRYPREFAHFQPECIGVDNFCSKTQLINAYDNSILYIDSMLEGVLNQLRDKKALLVYVSDHGESISDNMHFHGTPREMAPAEQFRVPFIIWASDKFLEDPANKARFNLLRQQAKAGVTHKHTEIFDSLLGCLGYRSPNGGINPQNNWCQEPATNK